MAFPAMNWLAWALLAAVMAALTALFAKAGVGAVNSHLATAIRTTVVLVFTWGIVAVTGRATAESLSAISRHTWMMLILSGIATGLSWLCYFRALQLGRVSQVAPIDKLSVVFVLVFAALFLGEPLHARTAFGAGLIAAGSILIALK
jgi:transporter family protein